MRLSFLPFSRPTSRACFTFLSVVLLGSRVAQASIPLDLDNDQSIRDAAKTAAAGMLEYYTGDEPGDVPGNLPDPYFWWEVGAMLNALIDYWYLTGDDQWNELITQAMLHQVGPNQSYMPPNQSTTLGNDDQAFWGMAALTAAENKYPNPPDDQPQWLALAQAVFNTQADRWEDETCAGGLRWQIFRFNDGFDYKNTISNGCFFNIAARLALYTGNQTYVTWAEKTWDWMTAIGIISPTFQAFDGTDVKNNCTTQDHDQWTYNNGILLAGAATMYNLTNRDDVWKQRVDGLLEGGKLFFGKEPPNVMTEVICEQVGNCNIDQRSFKAYLSRSMRFTVKVAPYTADTIMPRLRESAIHAALQCNGPNNACGLRWTEGPEYDDSTGVGEQMAALEVFQSHLIDRVPGPANSKTGISEGDPNAGSKGNSVIEFSDITVGDQVGAGFMTAVILALIMSGAWFMIS